MLCLARYLIVAPRILFWLLCLFLLSHNCLHILFSTCQPTNVIWPLILTWSKQLNCSFSGLQISLTYSSENSLEMITYITNHWILTIVIKHHILLPPSYFLSNYAKLHLEETKREQVFDLHLLRSVRIRRTIASL